MDNKRTPKFKELVPRWYEQREKFKKKFWRGVIHLFAWIGIAVIYYAAFSFFFDTPLEYQMKHSTRKLRQEYDSLSKRYATVEKVLYNVIDRDKQVFRTLFESDPYNFDTEFEKKRWETHEKLLTKSNKELGKEFFGKLNTLEKRAGEHLYTLATLEQTADSLKDRIDNIPAIQPVINKDLTLLTASYGMRIHPFYKIQRPPRRGLYGERLFASSFATADGRIKDVVTRNTTSGNTVVINHGTATKRLTATPGKSTLKKANSSNGATSSPNPATRVCCWRPTCT